MPVFDQFKQYLSQYHPLSEALTEYLRVSVTEETLPKNFNLLTAGEIPKAVWYIANGSARAHRYDDKTSDNLTIWYWRNELIMPFDGIYYQKPSQTNISLNQRSTVIALSYVHLKYLNSLFPEYHIISQGIFENINARLVRHLDLIQHEESAARYQFLLTHHAPLLLHANLKDIASFLGMSISTIKHLRYG